jgi:crotonobetainyl-CoA:carnitine CoA-transferase CaiB-like acyl-CoA transferase
VDPPLTGLRVVDLSTWIAGGYCTKLLADGGAEVVKVEDPAGDALRRWSASGAPISGDADGALFNFLHTSKQSVVVDRDRAELAALDELLASADAVVWSRGSALADHLAPRDLHRAHPHLTVTAITPLGLEGPWSDRPATEFTLQAWSGGIIGLGRGSPDREPVHVGGQIGEWLTGAFAAVGTLASLRRAHPGGELVDVSMLEVSATCLTYHPVTFADQLGRPFRQARFVPAPGVTAARDGLVGLGTGTGQQWMDFCVMVGHPEWMEDATLLQQPERTRLAPAIAAWAAEHTVAEVLEIASAFRVPNAPVTNGATITGFEHFGARRSFAPNPRDGTLNPRPPYRFASVLLRPPAPAPRLGEHEIGWAGPERPRHPRHRRPERSSPFSGVRVLDMTSFWAGPLVGHLLALLGAEVIHLEGPTRPDGARLIGGGPQDDQAWERGPIFAALNTNKKSLAIDLHDRRGVEVLRRFIGTCDVVVENYTPRVLDQLGLDHDTLRSEQPGLVVVRMPGFGLDGPWRDCAAFAFVVEDASGLTWLTGHADQPPIEPNCVGDPNAGLHALLGLMLAMEHHDRTGEGGLVEVAAVDAALNVAAEQVIEHSAYGALLERAGNRGPGAAPQNVYRAAGADPAGDPSWVAIAVADDEQWASLRRALGEPTWAADPTLAIASGRARAHDLIDSHLAAWCRTRPAAEIVERLWAAGVPVGEVVQPHRQGDLAQLHARGFFEEVDHPVAGSARYSTPPMRFSRGPDAWHHRSAPLLGEHTAEMLAELGLGPADLAALAADGVIASPDLTRAT